jgi:AcrR family transcriptional regulator
MIQKRDKFMARKKDEKAGRVLTKKGMATRAAILDAAHEVFRDTGYYASSVSEITRRAGVSLATFYQYFKNKEQVFQKLNDLVVERFTNKAESLSLAGLDFDTRWKKIITLLYDHTKNNLAFHRILGESELIDRVTLAYYEALARFLRNFLGKEAAEGNIRSLDPNIVAYGLIGICYFNSIKWEKLPDDLSEEQTVDLMVELIMNGISGKAKWKRPASWDILSLPEPFPLREETAEPLTKGEKKRQAILQAAEKVFGQHGINRASIAEITREAGVALGTFYVYFASKAQLVEGYVKYINRNLRCAIQRVAANMPDRRDAERAGIIVCFNFVLRHRKVYRIIPEFEMIDKEVALGYYKKTAQGYVQGLKQAMKKGEIRQFPPQFLAYSLMGMTHFIGLKWIIWTAAISPALISQTLKNNIEFVLWGLAPKK